MISRHLVKITLLRMRHLGATGGIHPLEEHLAPTADGLVFKLGHAVAILLHADEWQSLANWF